jgi:hypothetical protein
MERGAIVSGGVVKAAVVLAIVGVSVFDGMALVINRIQLDDIAGSALRAGLQAWESPATVRSAVEARLEREEDVRLDDLEVSRDHVELTVSRPARTLVLHRIGPIADATETAVTKEADRR